jgi:DNA-binding beta-propeller fold protein YncE
VSTGDDADAIVGDFLLVAHRPGLVSLFYDDGQPDGPQLLDVKANLPLEPTAITFDPDTKLAYLTVNGQSAIRGGVTGLSKLLARVGISADGDPRSAFLYDAGSLVIDAVSVNRDTRALTMNPSQPGQALVASRDPAALLFVDVGPDANGKPPATNVPASSAIEVGSGPARLAIGKLGERPIVAVSCFDGQELYIIDTSTTEVLAIVHNFNGAFELAIDSVRQRLYLADFRSSVVRVIDLSLIAANGTGDRTDAPVIGTLGIQKRLEELQ